jgi:hypothetical protein
MSNSTRKIVKAKSFRIKLKNVSDKKIGSCYFTFDLKKHQHFKGCFQPLNMRLNSKFSVKVSTFV